MANERICIALKELLGDRKQRLITQLLLTREIGEPVTWDEVCAAALREDLEVEPDGPHALWIRSVQTDQVQNRISPIAGKYSGENHRPIAAEPAAEEVAAKAREYVAAQKAEGKVVRITEAVAHVRKEMGLAATPTAPATEAAPTQPQEQAEAEVAGDLIREAQVLRTTLAKARPPVHISISESLAVERARLSGQVNENSRVIALLAVEHRVREGECGRVISNRQAVLEIYQKFLPGALKAYEAGGAQ